jgi:hypothetical protein
MEHVTSGAMESGGNNNNNNNNNNVRYEYQHKSQNNKSLTLLPSGQQQYQQQYQRQGQDSTPASNANANANAYGKPRSSSPQKASFIDWRVELKRFYMALNMPEKLATIDDILSNWAGQEDQMLSNLMVKYKKILPPQLTEHLHKLQTLMDTQTESSFVVPGQ